MNLQDLQTMIDYHYWARDRLFDALSREPPSSTTGIWAAAFKSIRDTVTHIYAAEWAWHARWRGQSPTAFAAGRSISGSGRAAQRRGSIMNRKCGAFVDGLGEAGVERVIEFRLLAGQCRRITGLADAPARRHHASYHRGQVTTMLRQIGAQPGSRWT